ncbi:MAG: SRPBCC family protein [Gemmatimonadaceae bacterium]
MASEPVQSTNASNPWLGAAIGGTLVFYGSRRRGAVGTLAGLAGAGIVARAIAPVAAALLRHAGLARQAVNVHTTLVVDRPVREMFALCSNFENFPRLVAGLRDVTDFDDGRSHWAIANASGELLEWDVIVTKYVPSQVIAWESVPNSPVESAGMVRFAPEGPNRTRLDLTVRYRPIYTSLRDAVRALIGPPRAPAVRAAMAQASNQLNQLTPSPGGATAAAPPPA